MTKKVQQRFKRVFGLVSVGVLCAVVMVVIVTEVKFSGLVVGGLGESFSTRFYSAPTILSEQNPMVQAIVFERLKRLHYQESKLPLTDPGQFNWSPPVLSITVRGFHTPLVNQQPLL